MGFSRAGGEREGYPDTRDMFDIFVVTENFHLMCHFIHSLVTFVYFFLVFVLTKKRAIRDGMCVCVCVFVFERARESLITPLRL